jgi:mannosylglycerate hydrolase
MAAEKSRRVDERTRSYAARMSDPRRVHVVPHTHWDREWYLPFQAFRLQLVDVLDELIPRMQADPSYAHFLLDGQLAVVDDYLAVRPQAAEALRDLVGSGRLSLGPWYTLPDEFLVSGETLIRDLQLGLRVAARFGGAMPIGYLPDMFGHIAQMPQILTQLGFDQAVVWRGVPSTVDRSGFWWHAPDGSTVRAEYLPQGYGNGSALPDDAKALVRQIAEFDEVWSELLGDSPILWMNGTDHQAPQPWLGRVIAEANDLQDDFRFEVTSLPEHLALAPTDHLPTWHGELRSGARANVLMGVTSNRVDVRQAAARAERSLEQLAEPLTALFGSPSDWPARLLDEAWLGMILNAAHDSVCACSIDEVCDAVLHRYAEATHVGDGLAQRALRRLGKQAAYEGPLVVNPSARPRSGLIELTLSGESTPAGTQLIRSRPAERVLLEGPVSMVVPGAEEIEGVKSIEGFYLEAEDGTILGSAERVGALITPAVRAALDAVEHPGTVRLRVRQQPTVTVLVHVEDVPGFGWAPALEPPEIAAEPHDRRVEVTQFGLSNGLVRVEVDPDDGTFSLDGHSGLGRLVDGGDCGDTYNWCPPGEDTLVDRPDRVEVEVTEEGPLRTRLAVRSDYRWPERCEGLARRVGELAHSVTTVLELRAGEPFVRVEVQVDNRSRDHRLRAHLPLPRPADHSQAECAFTVVERGLEAEGGATEAPLATYPARRFVQAGGLTVLHDGVTEYELVDIRDGAAHELAVTMLRSSGMLSQGPMTTRPLPAGPLIPTEGSQLQKPVRFRYAVAVGDVDPYALADDFLVPLQRARGRGGSGRPARGSALTVEGAEVSAVRREGGGLRVRVFNPSAETATVRLPDHQGWLVDLRGRPLEPFEGSFELRPWGLATLALSETS